MSGRITIGMPSLAEGMEEGTIIGWLKSEGDEVIAGDPLVEIETDKANMVYAAEASGTLAKIVAHEDETVPVGKPIAHLTAENEEEAAPEPSRVQSPDGTKIWAPSNLLSRDHQSVATPVARRLARELGVEIGDLAGSGPFGRVVAADVEKAVGRTVKEPSVLASPLARRVAKSSGIDLATIQGSGPRGRIKKADVESQGLVDRPSSDRGSSRRVELSRLQRTVARRMAQSKATIPHFQLAARIDTRELVNARRRLKENSSRAPSFNDYVIKACATVLRSHPRINASFIEDAIEEHSRINIGVAVAGADSLVVPTIFDADEKSLTEIAIESRQLGERVRSGLITPPELSGATFSISNLGMYGVDSFTAVIDPPQAAILAVGAIREVPVFAGGAVEPGHEMTITLSCDHRVIYGAQAAEFLTELTRLLSLGVPEGFVGS